MAVFTYVSAFYYPRERYDTIRDAILTCAVRSKADISQLNLPHGKSAKARDYGITGVRLSVCLSVCYHDN